MVAENRLWGQKRIHAELVRLGFQVSARTAAKYMRVCGSRAPGTWREFLTRHAPDILACDFFCVPTVRFTSFFVIRLANREILHVEVTRHPDPTRGSAPLMTLLPRHYHARIRKHYHTL
jgi:putative transposase